MLRKRALILIRSVRFKYLLAFSRVYGRKSYIGAYNEDTTIVREDIFTALDFRRCDNEALCIEEQLQRNLMNNRIIRFLSSWGGGAYSRLFIGEALTKEARSIFVSFRYAEKVYKEHNMDGIAYIYPGNFSLKIYKEIAAMGLLPNHIRLDIIALIYIRVYGWLRYIFFFSKIMSFLEIIILREDNKVPLKKDHYELCFNAYNGLMEHPLLPPEIFHDGKRFTKKDILIISDVSEKQIWESKIEKSGYLLININDMPSMIPRRERIIYIYSTVISWRFRLLFMSIINPWVISQAFWALRYRVLWDLFYLRFSSNNIVNMMTKENLTASIVHKKNNVRTVFLYTSSTEGVSNKVPCRQHIEYAHMLSDVVISCKISNRWLMTHTGEIGRYVENGVLFSDVVVDIKNNISEISHIRDRINLPRGATLISFFDHVVGNHGVLTAEAYHEMLETIVRMANNNKDTFYLFKSKKKLSLLKPILNHNSIELIKEIRSKKNCIYGNDFEFSAYDYIGVSDVVVSAPISSVIFESICGGVRTIIFDPLDDHKDYEIYSMGLPKTLARNYIELDSLINYWLNECSERDFIKFHKNILTNVDPYCDGRAIERLRSFVADQSIKI